MKSQSRLWLFAVLHLAMLLPVGAAPLGTAFTYQGRLQQNGSLANVPMDMQFSLWDAASGGSQQGATITLNDVGMTNGLFTVKLNEANQFGANAFTGDERWLNIAVRLGSANSGAYTTLTPRQLLTATPYALYAPFAQHSAGPWITAGTTLSYSNGNVGIGTTTPHHRLRIVGGPTWTSSGWTGALEFNNASALGWQPNTGGQRFGIGQANGGLYFFRTASDPGTNANPAINDMVINDAGRVGIGTASPTNKLSVSGDANITGNLSLGVPSYLALSNGTGSGNDMIRITSGNGSQSFTSVIFKNSAINFCIQNIAGSGGYAELHDAGNWTVGSDRRLKDDIQPLSGILDKTLALQPVSFVLKSQDQTRESRNHIGFVAQDVEPLFPSLVYGGEDGKMRTLDYSSMSVVAIGAIQEQQKIIESQKKKIEAMSERLERLEKLVDQLSDK